MIGILFQLPTGFPVGFRYLPTSGIEEGNASSVDSGMEDGNASMVDIDTGLDVAIASAVDASPLAWLSGLVSSPQAKENKINVDSSVNLKIARHNSLLFVNNYKCIADLKNGPIVLFSFLADKILCTPHFQRSS